MTLPLDVRDLVERPGTTREVHIAEDIPGLATEVARVPEPVRIDVRLESLVEGILVSGPLSTEVRYTCARCLREFSGGFEVQVAELFAEAEAELEAEYPLQDGAIDLEPMVRDALLLAMPFSPLCRPDCLGLCERCGGDRNLMECSCPPRSDPRWAALAGLDIDDGKEG